MMICWLRTNTKLRALQAEHYSRVHFIFILFFLISFMNGSSMSYMHTYALFIAYDLMAYAYLTHGRQEALKSRGVANGIALA